jgi:hypothetical protein
MKPLNHWLIIAGLALSTTLSITSCERLKNEDFNPQLEAKSLQLNLLATDSIRVDTLNPYQVKLESKTDNGNGTYSWTWSAQNPNPGDGTNGTYPDLDHLDFSLGHYLAIDNLISAEVSTDGLTWTTVRPEYGIDGSQTCSPDTILQVNLGTRSNTKSYYRISINSNNNTESGLNGIYVTSTGRCGTYQYTGFGSTVVDNSCSKPASFYFAKKYTWRTNVKIGGYTYTQNEAKLIYNTSDKGGIKDSKACFIQLVPIRFSTTISTTASVWADVAIVEDYLSRLGKLSPKNLPSGNPTARAAATRISQWIEAHPCLN